MYRAILLALLVAFSGCAATAPSAPSATDQEETAGSPTGTTSPTTGRPTATERPTATNTPYEPPPGNAWQADPIRVEIVAPNDSRADHRGMVREALDYWENGTTGMDLDYTVVEGPYSDVTVRFVDEVGYCESEAERTIGCADYVPPGGTVDGVTYVEVERGYNRSSTVDILTHEFGHTLGFDHDDDDLHGVMSATLAVTYLEQPNASDRESPWLVENLTVYVDDGDVPERDRDAHREQVGHALEYYRTADDSTLPAGTTLRTTGNRSAAHVVVDLDADAEHGEDAGSNGAFYGQDTDEDPALEYYTRVRIDVTGIDEDRVGWHVGSWLGYAFGAEDAQDLPEPFDDPRRDDRERWW